jgi:drug/metabolite transporter (DMT)-like permease
MKPLKADLLLLLVTVCWGSSYLFMKSGLNSVSEFNLIALRFGLAFLVSAVIFHKRLLKVDRVTLRYGIILGIILFGVFAGIMFGLKTTSTSNAGFLVSMTVIFVPILSALIFKEKIPARIIMGVVLAITGIGFLTLDSRLVLQPGDLLCILAALLYAVYILVTGVATKVADTLNLGMIQLGAAAGTGLVFSWIFESPQLPYTREGWISVLVLGLVCSAFGFICQPIAQKYTTPSHTGLIFALEPVFAALFGYLFASEVLPLKGYLGAALVLLGVLVAEIKINRREKRTSSSGKHWFQSLRSVIMKGFHMENSKG